MAVRIHVSEFDPRRGPFQPAGRVVCGDHAPNGGLIEVVQAFLNALRLRHLADLQPLQEFPVL
jgi:hypothetical protein